MRTGSLESLCLELEEGCGTSFADEVLSGAEIVDLRNVRKEIRKTDREKMLEKCAEEITAYCGGGEGDGVVEAVG